MARVKIRRLRLKDALAMADQMRDMDRLEYRIMSRGAPADIGMKHMFEVSDIAKAAYVDGELLCIWGRIKMSVLSSECCPWMVATPLIEQRHARREFLKAFPKHLDELTRGFMRSWNMVYEGNKLTIRWLKWVGFTFEGEPVIIEGHRFLPFEKRG